MKTLNLFVAMVLGLVAAPVLADDVIPSVDKENMQEYKKEFGKAVAESKEADTEKKAKPENFGSKVSNAARNSKDEISKDNKNFGSWVSKQRSNRPDEADRGRENSRGAKSSARGGRPSDVEPGNGRRPR
jgi:hypothetical protein